MFDETRHRRLETTFCLPWAKLLHFYWVRRI